MNIPAKANGGPFKILAIIRNVVIFSKPKYEPYTNMLERFYLSLLTLKISLTS